MSKMMIQGACLATVCLLVAMTRGVAASGAETDASSQSKLLTADDCLGRLALARRGLIVPEEITEFGMKDGSNIEDDFMDYPEESCKYIFEELERIRSEVWNGTNCEILSGAKDTKQRFEEEYNSGFMKDIAEAEDICLDSPVKRLDNIECADLIRGAIQDNKLLELDADTDDDSPVNCRDVLHLKETVMDAIVETNCLRYVISPSAAKAINSLASPQGEMETLVKLADLCRQEDQELDYSTFYDEEQ